MLPAHWQCASGQGEWAGATAGGCPNFDTTADNPQFLLSITQPTEVVVTLTQADKRVGAEDDDWNHASIGLYICTPGPGGGAITSRNMMHRNKVTSVDRFEGAREVTIKTSLRMRTDGSTSYVVVPMTFKPGIENKFTLRAFSPEGGAAVELQKC